MPWIDDVVPYTTILSTWGNNVRNHLVHQFSNRNDRDTNGRPVDGMLCVTVDTGCVWLYRASLGRWVPFSTPWKAFSVTLQSGGGGLNLGVSAPAAQYRYTSPTSIQVQCEAGMPTGIPALSGAFYMSLPVGVGASMNMAAGAPVGTGYAVNYRTGLGYGALVRADGNLPRVYFGLIGVGANGEMGSATFGTTNLWESSQWSAGWMGNYQVDAGPSDFL